MGRLLYVSPCPSLSQVALLTPWDPVVVHDVQEALPLLHDGVFGVALVDARSTLEGFELAHELTRAYPDLVRLVAGDVGLRCSVADGYVVWRYLVKPLEPEELKQAVSQAFLACHSKAFDELATATSHAFGEAKDAFESCLVKQRALHWKRTP